MASDIPEARDQLRQVAVRLRDLEHSDVADRIEEIVDTLMTRSFNGRKAPTKSKVVTSAMADQIVEYAELNPRASQQEIANHFGVNAGRVSEVLADRE